MCPKLTFFIARSLVTIWFSMACVSTWAIDIGSLRWFPKTETGDGYAEITISDALPIDASLVRARVATREAYAVAGLSYHPSLAAAKVSVRAAPKGQATLWIEGLPHDAASLDLLITVYSPQSLGLAEFRFPLRNGPQTVRPSPAGTLQTTQRAATSSPTVDKEPERPSLGTAMTADAAMAQAQAVLDTWAQAWSRQDVDTYLSAYTADYAGTPAQASRQVWMNQRRSRIVAAKHISVLLQNVQMQRQGNSMVCTFVQHYRSDQHSDVTRKRVVLMMENGRWHIQSEGTLAASP